MERTHCSRNKDEIVLVEKDPLSGYGGAYKPTGFWYEVDGDWRRWCEAEEFGCGRYLFSVDLGESRVLKIDTLLGLDAFHRQFYTGNYRDPINWKSIAEKWDGLEIAPYRHERRMEHDFMWYYGWDVASGVVWKPRGAKVTFLRDLHAPKIPVDTSKSSVVEVTNQPEAEEEK